MQFKIGDLVLDAPEQMRVGELVEAERALGFSMDAGSGAQLAVLLFVAMRKHDPDKPTHLLAGDVLNSDISTVEEVEENPPAKAAEEAAIPENLEVQQTSGALHSVQSA